MEGLGDTAPRGLCQVTRSWRVGLRGEKPPHCPGTCVSDHWAGGAGSRRDKCQQVLHRSQDRVGTRHGGPWEAGPRGDLQDSRRQMQWSVGPADQQLAMEDASQGNAPALGPGNARAVRVAGACP